MNELTDQRNSGFGLGLLMGVCVGAGVVLWLAPRMTAEIRGRAAESLDKLAETASTAYRQTAARVGETVDAVNRKTRDIRDAATS